MSEGTKYSMGMMLYKHKRYKDAEKHLREVTGKNAKKSMYIVAKICKDTGRIDEAEKIFKQLVEMNGKEALHSLVELARIYFQERGKYDESEEILKYCDRKMPNSLATKQSLGELYVVIGKYDKAKEQFRRCLKIDKEDRYAKQGLARALISNNEYDEAENILQHLISEENELNSNRIISTKIMYGNMLMRMGRYSDAKDMYDSILAVKPDCVSAIMGLCKISTIESRDEEASMMYDYIIENSDEDNEADRIKHIEKHLQNDLTKAKHGVFTKNPIEIMDELIKNKGKKRAEKMCDIYCIPAKECGYEGGAKGDNHILDYITMITLPNSDKIITMFPSDEIKIKEKAKENKFANKEDDDGTR